MAEVLRRLAADVRHRLALDRPPLLEIRKRSAGCAGVRRRTRAHVPDAAQDAARVLLDVFVRDAPVWSGALDVIDVDANFTREAAD